MFLVMSPHDLKLRPRCPSRGTVADMRLWKRTAFAIHASDEQGENLQPNVFGAPSRPPSRVNDRDMIDLTDAHAAGIYQTPNQTLYKH